MVDEFSMGHDEVGNYEDMAHTMICEYYTSKGGSSKSGRVIAASSVYAAQLTDLSRDYSQKELAEKFDCNPHTIGNTYEDLIQKTGPGWM
jgi:transcription initiation factor TFIIIB Brf1 subunit/transcription initiation factor TFIIB